MQNLRDMPPWTRHSSPQIVDIGIPTNLLWSHIHQHSPQCINTNFILLPTSLLLFCSSRSLPLFTHITPIKYIQKQLENIAIKLQHYHSTQSLLTYTFEQSQIQKIKIINKAQWYVHFAQHFPLFLIINCIYSICYRPHLSYNTHLSNLAHHPTFQQPTISTTSQFPYMTAHTCSQHTHIHTQISLYNLSPQQ